MVLEDRTLEQLKARGFVPLTRLDERVMIRINSNRIRVYTAEPCEKKEYKTPDYIPLLGFSHN